MIRTKLAKKVLTKKDQDQLQDVNINSMAVFVRSRKGQIIKRKIELANGLPIDLAEPCFECALIAQKLGIE